MTITYEYYNSLYVNITNRCSNDCVFCVRNKKDDVNGEDNLWLEYEPGIDEIKEDFEKRDLNKYEQIVFCGYGEPTARFDDIIIISRWLKEKNPNIYIRLNTNGQANLVAGRDVTPEMHGFIDEVSISLNADNADKYQKICRSEFGADEAFEGLKSFAVKAKNYVKTVKFTVVDKVMGKEEIENCKRIAQECGVELRIRPLIQ